jgi:hypothetical protein
MTLHLGISDRCRALARAVIGGGLLGVIAVSPAAAGPQEARTAGTDRWAVVSAPGTLVRDQGAASVKHISTSWYHVGFDNSVSDCVSVATPGNPGGGLPPKGQVTAGFGNLEITVHTDDSTGNKVDFGFHLLVLCPSGSRSAATRSEGPRSESPPEMRTTTTDRWAVVNKDGTLVRGAGVASLARLGTGAYEVIFDRNVRSCVYIATLARDRQNFGYPVGEISTAPRGNNTNGVYIRTWFTSGEKYDRSFHLYVGCA